MNRFILVGLVLGILVLGKFEPLYLLFITY